jgi:hypothetical protein
MLSGTTQPGGLEIVSASADEKFHQHSLAVIPAKALSGNAADIWDDIHMAAGRASAIGLILS